MDLQLVLFILIGFAAQMVDGALGMAFGVIVSSSLIATGATPAIASAAVHAAEIVTTGISGASHVWHRNVDRALFLRLTVAGVLGGITGAYVLTGLPVEIVKPAVTIYLAAMAVLIIARLAGRTLLRWHPPTPLLGLGGGFCDAVGGGGWGPLVVSTLLARGDEPRPSVGSVNLAEFFVTVAISAAFFFHLDLADYGRIVLGLIIGGALAAPLAGYALRILPMRLAMILVAVVLTALCLYNLASLLR